MDKLSILISALLDKNVAGNLKTQLNSIKNLSVDVKTNIDSTEMKALTQQFSKLNASIALTGDHAGKVNNLVQHTTDEYGNQIQLVSKLNKETGVLEQTTLKINNNQMDMLHKEAIAINKKVDLQRKQHTQAIAMNQKISTQRMDALHKEAIEINKLGDLQRKQMDDALRMTQQRKQKERLDLEKQQSIAINKNNQLISQQGVLLTRNKATVHGTTQAVQAQGHAWNRMAGEMSMFSNLIIAINFVALCSNA